MSDPYKTPDFVKAQRWITLSMSVHIHTFIWAFDSGYVEEGSLQFKKRGKVGKMVCYREREIISV